MLKRLFIKNYNNTNDPEVRSQYGKVAGIFGIITNLVLGIVKFIIGSISNSVSIMADAVNNISDTATSVLTLVGFKISNKKPDRKHPYGYARYEYVAGLIIAILMLLMGLSFVKESIINKERRARPHILLKVPMDNRVYEVLLSALFYKGNWRVIFF